MLKNKNKNLRKLANAHLWIVQNPMMTTVLSRSEEILHHFIINFDEPLDSDSRPNEGQTSLLSDDDREFKFKGLFVDHEGTSAQAGGSGRKMRIALHPEVDAVAAGEACENFTVLIHVKAPSASEASKKQNYEDCEGNTVKDPGCHAPIDLVTVLDVSGSMSGTKLALLKRAMAFVISNLSLEDHVGNQAGALETGHGFCDIKSEPGGPVIRCCFLFDCQMSFTLEAHESKRPACDQPCRRAPALHWRHQYCRGFEKRCEGARRLLSTEPARRSLPLQCGE